MMKVILIDDNQGYADSLYDSAYAINIELFHFQGLEEGLDEIKNNPLDYAGIILDGRGWLSEDAPTETDSHVHKGIYELGLLKQQGIYIPHVINTGYFDQLAGQVQHLPQEIIFDKTKGAAPMFAKLLELVSNSPLQKLKTKFPEPFESFGGKYLPQTSLSKLVDLLTWMEEGSFNRNYFNTIRDLIEEALKRANVIDSTKFLPTALLRPAQDGRPNLKACEMYLTGRPVDLSRMGGTGTVQATSPIFPPHIGWLFSSLTTNSQILSHNYTPTVTPYAFSSSVLALIEILIWFRNYVDSNYPNVT